MLVDCPHCFVRLSVHPSQAGEVAVCPKCSGRFQVPLPQAQATGSPFASGSSDPYVRAFATKKVPAGICGILLGGFGIHKFVLGLNSAGAIMLTVWLFGLITGACFVVPIFASIAMNIIGMVEGIIYLTKTDEEFYQLYAVERKEWL